LLLRLKVANGSTKKGGRIKLTLFQQEGQDPGQHPDAVQGLIEVDVVGSLDDLAQLGRGLREQRRHVFEPFVPQPPGGAGGDQFEDLLGAAWDLPKLVPEVGIVGGYVHLDQGRDGLAELLTRRGGSHPGVWSVIWLGPRRVVAVVVVASCGWASLSGQFCYTTARLPHSWCCLETDNSGYDAFVETLMFLSPLIQGMMAPQP
jgi:hypothetical protein